MKKVHNKNYLENKNKTWIILIVSLIIVELFMCISIISVNLLYPNLKAIVFSLIVIFTILLLFAGIVFFIFLRQFKNALKREDIVSANINDDLMNPLCAIHNNIQLALSTDNLDKIQDTLGDALQETRNLTLLMERLMLIRNAYFGNLDYHFEKANIIKFIDNLSLPYKDFAEMQNKNLIINNNNIYEPLYFDKEKLQEILNNLLDNSFKYTKPTDKIIIDLSTAKDYLVIKVIDTGIGVSDFEINNIFKKFYQTKNGKAVNPLGNGIGLTLVEQLILSMNGSVTAEKNFPKGLKITISLPCKKYNTF